jgi:predicted metal-binding membrane protein
MYGMDMGVATRLGSFACFVALWVSMMAAMLLPDAAPAVFPAETNHSGRQCLQILPCAVSGQGAFRRIR